MKAMIGETDNGAVKGEVFWRNEDDVSIDDEKGLLYIWVFGTRHTKIKEVINMLSPNFHSVKFEEI